MSTAIVKAAKLASVMMAGSVQAGHTLSPKTKIHAMPASPATAATRTEPPTSSAATADTTMRSHNGQPRIIP
ncbi:MAG: hypothetical protein ABR588_11905 [Sphingomicrobium sp.]|nr:hypothetical protein [Sphingomonadales bacterium]